MPDFGPVATSLLNRRATLRSGPNDFTRGEPVKIVAVRQGQTRLLILVQTAAGTLKEVWHENLTLESP